MKAISTTSRAMHGSSSTSGTRARMPRTCGGKMLVDWLDFVLH